MSDLITQLRTLYPKHQSATVLESQLRAVLPGTLQQNLQLFLSIQMQMDIELACAQIGVGINQVPACTDDELEQLIAAHMARRTFADGQASKTRSNMERLISLFYIPAVAHFEQMLKEPVNEIGMSDFLSVLRKLHVADGRAESFLDRAEQLNSPNASFLNLARQFVRDIADGAIGMLGFSFYPGLGELLSETEAFIASNLEPLLQATAAKAAQQDGHDVETVKQALMIYIKELSAVAVAAADATALAARVGMYESED